MGERYGCTCSTDYLTLNGYVTVMVEGGSVRLNLPNLKGLGKGLAGERLSRKAWRGMVWSITVDHGRSR